jgi:hypothetical protein
VGLALPAPRAQRAHVAPPELLVTPELLAQLVPRAKQAMQERQGARDQPGPPEHVEQPDRRVNRVFRALLVLPARRAQPAQPDHRAFRVPQALLELQEPPESQVRKEFRALPGPPELLVVRPQLAPRVRPVAQDRPDRKERREFRVFKVQPVRKGLREPRATPEQLAQLEPPGLKGHKASRGQLAQAGHRVRRV